MQVDLREAFFQRVKAFADAHGLSTAYPNKQYDPPQNEQKYIDTSVVSTTPTVLTPCGGYSRYIWILRVSVMVRANTGEMNAADLCDELLPEFPYSSKLFGASHEFTVITPASPSPPIDLGAWVSTPVSFRVSCFK